LRSYAFFFPALVTFGDVLAVGRSGTGETLDLKHVDLDESFGVHV
jgi:hypothetical protein